MTDARFRTPLFLLALAAGSSAATGQLRVATWNISHFDGSDRLSDVATAVYGTYNGRQFAPDVILLQEMESAAAVQAIAATLNNAIGATNDWRAAPYVNGADIDNCCVYRSSRVTLVGDRNWVIAVGSSDAANQPRNTNRFDIRPVGYVSPGATISMYCSHMKAGDTASDVERRRVECERIRNNAQGEDTNGAGSGKPAGYLFLLGGDFNMQSASQSAYVELVASQADNSGRFFDPIHSGNNGGSSTGSWNNSGTYRFIHTQDPSGPGGMDDRHDQILVCGELVDGSGFDYIGNALAQFSQTTWNDPNHSYRCWGNDGTSFNLGLTVTGNAMVGPVIAQALRNCATTAGGHLPVYLDLRLPPELAAPTVVDFGTVVQNSVAQQVVQVGNAGDVAMWGAAGVASISYSLSATNGFGAPGGTFTDAAGGGLNSHTITMNTATTGIKTGTLTISGNAPDEPIRTISITGRVVAANVPPVADAGPDQNITDLDGSGAETVTLNGSASTDPDGTIVLYRWAEGASTLASGASATADVSLAVGVHTIELTVTDNNAATDSDTVTITVSAPCIADYNQDGGIDGGDVEAFFMDWESGSAGADVNLDGGVDGSDVEFFFVRWEAGAC